MPTTANSTQNHSPPTTPMVLSLSSESQPSSSERPVSGFDDRRAASADIGRGERRQFGSSHSELSPDAKELAIAIDRYKLESRRRYITCEEMLAVVKQLGYRRD